MDNLTVTPEYLETLAAWQDKAAENADEAKHATAHTLRKLTGSHGAVSKASNEAADSAEGKREKAAAKIKQAAEDLAYQLRHTVGMYEGTDDAARRSIDRQMH